MPLDKYTCECGWEGESKHLCVFLNPYSYEFVKSCPNCGSIHNLTQVFDEHKSMIEKRSIEEFRNSGLLLLVNQFLHIFGWALVVEVDEDGKATNFYPKHCKFRGFDNRSTKKAYKMVTYHMKDRLPDLLKDVES